MTADGFDRDLLAVLPRLLAEGGAALPDDWRTEATTYDLNRFTNEADFVVRFREIVKQIAESPSLGPAEIRVLIASAGQPTDYARLGQPFSTIYELLVEGQTGVRKAISFASRTKPFLAVIEAHGAPGRGVRIYARGVLPLSAEKTAALRAAHVEIHEAFVGPIPAPVDDAIVVYVDDRNGLSEELLAVRADALVYPVENGGVLLLTNDRLPVKSLQLVRKRTAAALLATDAHRELCLAAGVSGAPGPTSSDEQCHAALVKLFPEVVSSATFVTGLAAEAAVFSAAARMLDPARAVPLFYAENGYGGTCQLIAELLSRDGVIEPRPLRVLSHDEAGNPISLVDRMVAAVTALGAAPAILFLETPTNPELQMHDFPKLFAALRAHADATGQIVPVLADTTLAPLYPLLAQPFAKDWPCVIVKSGSKYFTKGKATLGVTFAAENAGAQTIVRAAAAYGRDADTLAKPSQLAPLAEGLGDLRPRMARIAENTIALVEGMRAAIQPYGRELTVYAMNAAQRDQGLASGLLSFYLPPAPTTHADLVDELVDTLLREAPAIVKNRVSYGQSSGEEKQDVFYVINPEESTQGALSAEVKAAQKRDNVQIGRISVPANADVPGFLRVIERFFAAKYGVGAARAAGGGQ